MFDLVIRGGRVVAPDGIISADIGIEDQRIAAVGPGLAGGTHEIDARGLTVLPGMIDIHLHFNEPGRTDWEGAETGSKALAAGGGTLFFDMPLNSSPCTVGAAEFEQKRAALAAASITDFALWGGLIPGNRAQMDELAACGVVGFKAFLCDSGLEEFPRADDVTLFEGMQEAAKLGLPVAVHAESEEITSTLARRIVSQGRGDIAAFLESRPVLAEVEAILRAGLLAREAGCKLHIVHISSGRGVAAALEARAAGTDISIETCPHYLLFTADDLERIGALAKCTPPLRDEAERRNLVAEVRGGAVEMVASDHSPCPPEMKASDSFFGIWGGIAGVQFTRLALAAAGVDPQRIAALTAANGARRFGIANRGAIAPGMVADINCIDFAGTTTVTDETLFQRHRGTLYAGTTFPARVTHTVRRGEIIYRNGEIMARSKGVLVRPEGIQ